MIRTSNSAQALLAQGPLKPCGTTFQVTSSSAREKKESERKKKRISSGSKPSSSVFPRSKELRPVQCARASQGRLGLRFYVNFEMISRYNFPPQTSNVGRLPPLVPKSERPGSSAGDVAAEEHMGKQQLQKRKGPN